MTDRVKIADFHSVSLIKPFSHLIEKQQIGETRLPFYNPVSVWSDKVMLNLVLC